MPYELLFGKALTYGSLRSFGCLAFTSNLIAHIIKFESRIRRCIFIGYLVGTEGYKLYDMDSHTTLVSRDIVFYEHIFPLHNNQFYIFDDSVDASNLVLPIISHKKVAG